MDEKRCSENIQRKAERETRKNALVFGSTFHFRSVRAKSGLLRGSLNLVPGESAVQP
jgi:hypothetical protein